MNEARARESRPSGSFSPSAPPAWGGAPAGESARPAPARRFGPDAKPSRGGRSRGPKQERKVKGPIRERGGGRIFDADDDDWRNEDVLEDDLASSKASESDEGE